MAFTVSFNRARKTFIYSDVIVGEGRRGRHVYVVAGYIASLP